MVCLYFYCFFLGLFALLFHLFDVLTFTMCLLYARNFFGAFPSACMEDGPIKHNDIVFQDTHVNLYFVQVFLIISTIYAVATIIVFLQRPPLLCLWISARAWSISLFTVQTIHLYFFPTGSYSFTFLVLGCVKLSDWLTNLLELSGWPTCLDALKYDAEITRLGINWNNYTFPGLLPLFKFMYFVWQ
jgi:hypothetical protein